MFKKHMFRGKEVEAVQFTHENKNQVFNSLTGQYEAKGTNENPSIRVLNALGNTEIVTVSDWIIKEDKLGYYYVISDDVFTSEKGELKKLDAVIVCAAIRNKHTGLIITGARHYDSIMLAQILALSGCPQEIAANHKDHEDQIGEYDASDWVMADQGFIDQYGKFYTREEALAIVKVTGQRVRRCGGDHKKLFSENLY